MTRNADSSSVPHDQRFSVFYFNWKGFNYVPNAVPIEFGANVGLRSVKSPQKLNISSGIGGTSGTIGGLIKGAASAEANLASTRAPKYNISILFLEVSAHILGRNRISWPSKAGKHDIPQRDENV